jgi:hypothetical protein
MALRGTQSETNLSQVHPDLVEVIREAAKYVDFVVTEGYRSPAEQIRLFNEKKSKIRANGKHNQNPSLAVDIVPWKAPNRVDYQDVARMRHIVFFIRGIAAAKGIDVRLGADWDSDFNHANQTFHDVPHIELKAKWNDATQTWTPYV